MSAAPCSTLTAVSICADRPITSAPSTDPLCRGVGASTRRRSDLSPEQPLHSTLPPSSTRMARPKSSDPKQLRKFASGKILPQISRWSRWRYAQTRRVFARSARYLDHGERPRTRFEPMGGASTKARALARSRQTSTAKFISQFQSHKSWQFCPEFRAIFPAMLHGTENTLTAAARS